MVVHVVVLLRGEKDGEGIRVGAHYIASQENVIVFVLQVLGSFVVSRICKACQFYIHTNSLTFCLNRQSFSFQNRRIGRIE